MTTRAPIHLFDATDRGPLHLDDLDEERATSHRGRWSDDGEVVRCAHCGEWVETTFARGRCDTCHNDRLLAALDEVSRFDVDVALALGRLSFHAHLDRQASIELTSDPEYLAWCDARREETMEHETQRLPWHLDWTPADAVVPANDSDDAGEAA